MLFSKQSVTITKWTEYKVLFLKPQLLVGIMIAWNQCHYETFLQVTFSIKCEPYKRLLISIVFCLWLVKFVWPFCYWFLQWVSIFKQISWHYHESFFSRYLFFQSQQWKQLNNKDTRTMLLTSFWCLYW